jgi:hypothetical protein
MKKTFSGNNRTAVFDKIILTSIICFFTCLFTVCRNPEPVYIDETALDSIRITRVPDKKNYKMGEELSTTGLVIENVYTNGNTETTGDYNITGDTFTAGITNVTVVSKTDASKTAIFIVNVFNELINTGLPVIYIETQNAAPIVSKENYINGKMLIKYNNTIVHENTLRIRGRGNATWGYPKKPYKIKLDKKANFFGMGNDKDWVLLANYCDKTLLRTGIALKLSKLMNFPWTPDAQFVEVVLNGHYLGNYQLVEGIKKDSNRVNVSDSGYLIERDNYYLQEPKFFVTTDGYGYSFKYPDTDDLTDAQWNYIKNYMNDIELALSSPDFSDPSAGYRQYMDIDSFVRWFLFQNIIANLDTNLYLTKADDTTASKIHMGPVWDFEWSMGIGWYDGLRPRPADYWVWNHWYYERLLQDTEFTAKLKSLWNTNKTATEQGILNYISEAKAEITVSQELNFRRWDILNTRVSVGGIPLGSFEAEVECDRQFFINHIKWLNGAINGL